LIKFFLTKIILFLWKVHYNIIGDYDVSEEYYNKSIGLYKTLGDVEKTAHFQIMKASLYIVQKKYVDAFLILNEVKKNADEKIGANVNYSIAYIYQEIENFEEALKYIHLALKYYEETNNNFQITNKSQ
jgi:tetratricopeptide (TPR) repeat protein